MATIKDLEIEKHLDPFILSEIPDLRTKVDFGDLIAAVIAGGMNYLTRPDRNPKCREYVNIVEGNAIYNEKACFMALKTDRHHPSVCGRLLYCNYKRFYSRSIKEPELFKYVTNEINYYGDYDRHATANDEPYTIRSISIIDEAFMTLFNRLKEKQIVVGTFACYALVYTDEPYTDPSIEIHHA